jgi:hypothetical protein
VLSRLQNFPPVDIELVMFFMVSARRRHKGVPALEKISQRLLRQPEAAFKVLLSFDAETHALAGNPVVERPNAIGNESSSVSQRQFESLAFAPMRDINSIKFLNRR